MPSHLGLCGKKSERLMGSNEEAVTDCRARFLCEVIGFVIEVLIGLRANDVTSTHRVPVFFKRSSRWRCFSSQ